MTSHLRLDLDGVEYLNTQSAACSHQTSGVRYLSVVDTNDGSNHLWDDDHVTEMCLDDGGFLIWWGFLFGLAQFLDETHGAALETALETSASTGVNELDVAIDWFSWNSGSIL